VCSPCCDYEDIPRSIRLHTPAMLNIEPVLSPLKSVEEEEAALVQITEDQLDRMPSSSSVSALESFAFWDVCHECMDVSAPFSARGWKDAEYGLKARNLAIELVLVINYIYWFQWAIHDVFCNFLFRCGCAWIFDGAWRDCNYFTPGVPQCPWCKAKKVSATSIPTGQLNTPNPHSQ
jgi:hypothetical protein